MKKQITIILFLLVGILTGCNTCKKNGAENIHIAAINNPLVNAGNIGALRLKFLTETATLVGAQGGLAWRSEQINCVLRRQETQLDKIYNFRALLLKDDIKPPVLEEGRDELAQSSCVTLRTSDQIFRIVSPPCFVTAPPNWRDYIWMKFCQPEQPDVTLLPQNRQEAGVWNCYVQTGWKQGIEQANQIFAENLSRLKRDYNGMLLYRKLLAQNMVTPPYVSKTELGVTGNENELRINDRVLMISATSRLNTNADSWKPIVAKTGPNEVCDSDCCAPLSPPPMEKCTTIIRKKIPLKRKSCKKSSYK